MAMRNAGTEKRFVSISLPSREFHNVSMHDDVSWTKTDDYIFFLLQEQLSLKLFLLAHPTHKSVPRKAIKTVTRLPHFYDAIQPKATILLPISTNGFNSPAALGIRSYTASHLHHHPSNPNECDSKNRQKEIWI